MIKVGILGTGFGETHLKLFSKIEGFEVVSIFGRNQEKLKTIEEKYKVTATNDVTEIIENPNIDIIDICLPTELHSKWAIEGLKNGKHIFCETPVTYNVDEAVAMQQAVAKYERNVFVNLFIKFSAPHQLAAELIKKSECGKLLGIRTYNKTSARWGDLSLQKNVATFHNHMMDFAIELAGMPKSVAAPGIDYGEGKSIVTSTFINNGLYAVMESNSAMPEGCSFEIGFELLCSDGVIRFDAAYGEYTNGEFSIVKSDKPREVLQLDEKDDYEEVIKHIRDCLQNGVKGEFLDIEAAIKTVKLKEMIMHSIC